MEKIIFVEILDKHHRVKQRIRVQNFPCKIGSAYHNDIIVDDRHVAHEEALISVDEQGEVSLSDVHSCNGIIKRGSFHKITTSLVHSGDIFTVGQTPLRIMFSDHPVAEPIKFSRGLVGMAERNNGVTVPVLIVLFGWFVVLLEMYLSQTSELSWSVLFNDAIKLILITLGIAGAWAISTRIVSHESRFLLHLANLLGMMLIMLGIDIGSEYISYIWSWSNYRDAVLMTCAGIISTCWLFIHLCIASEKATARKFVASLAIVSALFGLYFLDDLHIDESDSNLHFAEHIKPHGLSLINFSDSQTFFEQSKILQQQLDEESEEKKQQ